MPAPKKKETRNRSSLLTEKQEKYVEARASGLQVKDSMVAAGMKPHDGTGNALEKHPGIKSMLKAEQRKNAYMLGLTREDVLKGMMEAIDDAKILSDPLTQIAGWREVAKICGFYAPDVKKVEISGSGKAVIDKMRQLSDAELLQIAEGEVIDVEFDEVKH
jgi:phage terminase small subunit